MERENFKVLVELSQGAIYKPLLEWVLTEARVQRNDVTTDVVHILLFTTHKPLDNVVQYLQYRQQARLLRFINHKAFLSKLSETASTMFDRRFVHKHVMEPAIDRMDILRKLQVEMKTKWKKQSKNEKGRPPKSEKVQTNTEVRTETKDTEVVEVKESKSKKEPSGKIDRQIVKKLTVKKNSRPPTSNSLKKYSTIRDLKLLNPIDETCRSDKNPRFKLKLNKASILRTGATVNQSIAQEEKLIRRLATGTYFNPYQEQMAEAEANILRDQLAKRDLVQKQKRCHTIRQGARRAQRLRLKRRIATANLLKNEKLALARQWRLQRDQDLQRVKQIYDSLQASRNFQRKMAEQKREAARSMNQDLQQQLQAVQAVWQRTLDDKMRRFKEPNKIDCQRLGSNKMNDKTSTTTPSIGLLCELSLVELQNILQRMKNQKIQQMAKQRAKKQAERKLELANLVETLRKIDKHNQIQKQQRLKK